jgi:hypothetical protein
MCLKTVEKGNIKVNASKLIGGCIQKFPDWPPTARTAYGTAFWHWMQLYRYFMGQSSEFCRHNPLKGIATSNIKGKHIYFFIDSVWKLLDSSVGIALGYGLDDRGSGVRFPAGAGNFSLHHRVQNGSGAHPASYPMGTRGSFPGNKEAGAWSWPLTSI